MRARILAAITILAATASAQGPAVAPELVPVPEDSPAIEPPSRSADERLYWILSGGGEVIGRLVKEVQDTVYIDIGPRIIEIPKASIVSRETLEQAAERGTLPRAGEVAGVFDPETGSLVFRAGNPAEKLTQPEIVARAKKCVVLISNPRGAGSGFIMNKQGAIITNYHVIAREKYHTVNIFRQNGNQWERIKIENVPVKAYSPLYDIAMLQLDLEEVAKKGIELEALPLASDEQLQVGDSVYAIGNPGVYMRGGRLLEHTVSEGIVSSMARNINDILYIQTTAAVNPGNSGGPLINQRGEVVGLVTLKAFMQEGIGFALPVELMRQFIEHSESYAFSEQAQNEGYRYLPPE